jgi:hypothetical protein
MYRFPFVTQTNKGCPEQGDAARRESATVTKAKANRIPRAGRFGG